MTRNITQDHFDDRAADYYQRNYEHARTRHERALTLRRGICVDLLQDVGGRILDLGSGPGAMTMALKHPSRRIVAFDLAPNMVHKARALAGDIGSGYCVGTATSLPFVAGAFDAVVSTGVLEYISDLEGALDEVHRVLRPGGAFVASVSLPRTLERAVTRAYMRFVGRDPSSAPFHRAYTPGELDTLVEERSFRIEKRRFSYFAPFPLDVAWPRAVTWLDALAPVLERSKTICSQAKTYVVRAVRL